MIFIVNTEIKNNKKSKNKVFTLNTKVVVSAIGFLIPEKQLKKFYARNQKVFSANSFGGHK